MDNKTAEYLFKIGARFRNPGIFEEYERRKKTDFLSIDRLKEIQRNKLSKLFTHFEKHSNFYKPIISEFNSKDPLEALQEFPIISKAELINNLDIFNAYSSFSKLIESETSGSTGQPFVFKKDLGWDSKNRAALLSYYDWYDVKPWFRNGYFWGYNLDPSKYKTISKLDYVQNRFRVFSYQEEEMVSFLEKLKSADYMHGYSSMIYESAQIAVELGYVPTDFQRLKMIKGTSEKIYPHYQEAVLKAFGKNIISEYGSAEAGIIAFECPYGNMHVNEENVVVEEINGEAIVTNLNAFSLPIIRYNTGDAIVLEHGATCGCKRQTSIIKEIKGRVGKRIIGTKNNYPSLTLYYVFKNIALEKTISIPYQGIQEEKGSLLLILDPKEKNPMYIDWVKEQCRVYYNDDLKVKVKFGKIIHTKEGKLKDFISKIK